MPRTFADQLKQLVHRYNRERISLNELNFELIRLAAHAEFYEHFSTLPAEVMPRLRQMAEEAPAHPEDAGEFYLGSIFESPMAWRRADTNMRVSYYWACRRLRQYFYPEMQMPEFELEKCIGVVEEVCKVDGEIVLLGEFRTFLVRRNHVSVRQNGESFPIFIDGTTRVKRDSDQQSEDFLVRDRGREGLIVALQRKCPYQVAVGAELWVDRTEVREVPEPPKVR